MHLGRSSGSDGASLSEHRLSSGQSDSASGTTARYGSGDPGYSYIQSRPSGRVPLSRHGSRTDKEGHSASDIGIGSSVTFRIPAKCYRAMASFSTSKPFVHNKTLVGKRRNSAFVIGIQSRVGSAFLLNQPHPLYLEAFLLYHSSQDTTDFKNFSPVRFMN